MNELEGILVATSGQNNTNKARFIFILENASLEVAKVGKTYQLLNSDNHAYFLKQNIRNPADYGPDIVHQALLMILDSQLNKSGMVRAVYVRTEKGVLFEVKPHARLPRTFKHFSGLMYKVFFFFWGWVLLLLVSAREKLLRVIKNTVSWYLPVNSCKIGLSHSSEKLVNINNYVGTMAHGKIDREVTDDFISRIKIRLICPYSFNTRYTDLAICKAYQVG
ncbi:ribosomal RNA small subunit methyltransferase NEP1-like [Fagus crenata]